MKPVKNTLRRVRSLWRTSECLQNETWRWGILLALLILVLTFGGNDGASR